MASGSSMVSSSLSQRLSGKVALVTGGASGIGESIVRLLLKCGAKVCIADVQDDLGRRLCDELKSQHCTSLLFRHCNVAIEDDVKQAVDHTVNKFGTLDIMVNNAGQLGPQNPDIRDFELSTFEQVLDVNVKGVFLGMKHAARIMIPANKGSIVSLCSVAGVVGGFGSHAYTCSKHAVLGLTRYMAGELGQHGIRVNCVSPFGVPTHMSLSQVPAPSMEDALAGFQKDIKRVSNLKGVEFSVEDVANAVVFLCCDEARCISGANLIVDGGLTSVNQSFRFF